MDRRELRKLKAVIRTYTREAVKSPASAKAALVNEKIYTADGKVVRELAREAVTA